jgi:hypothetical protein
MFDSVLYIWDNVTNIYVKNQGKSEELVNNVFLENTVRPR